jgi:hypothetical protein
VVKKDRTNNEGLPGSSVQPTRASMTAKPGKPGDKCDARDAVLKIEQLSESSVKVFLAAGWEGILPQHGEDDPGLLMMWNSGNLQLTVANINSAGPTGPALPAYLEVAVPVTQEQLMVAILSHVQAEAGGGGFVGNCLIAPNTLTESYRMISAPTNLC